METVKVPIHEHPLLSLTRFTIDRCKGCKFVGYIYGGYRCNEIGCESVFHKECAESLPEINHSSHPDHPLKLVLKERSFTCSGCSSRFCNGYFCSVCDFKLDLRCAGGLAPPFILKNANVHEHPLELYHIRSRGYDSYLVTLKECKTCGEKINVQKCYRCYQCELVFHVECAKFFPKPNSTSHPQHPLKIISWEAAPNYADKNCLLCGVEFINGQLNHCDVCNFSICQECMSNPPPLGVVSRTTHEHQLHLVPRRLDFTCNACGTEGNRSPYFCLQCNFMIHHECIDLPRVININRHDHRISYTPRLGHGEWKCGVCHKNVDGFYGGYSCSKCSNYAVHSRCATRRDVWDMIELEGIPEEPEVPPFVVIDDNTIKHISHDHNLRITKDGRILHESTLCQACVFQICSEPFYSCEQCSFILHQKCANFRQKKRHMCHNQPFTLDTDSKGQASACYLCRQWFSGFKYMSLTGNIHLDVRCGTVSEPLVLESHPHPLYYSKYTTKSCAVCGNRDNRGRFSCDECDYCLDFKCALLPQKVMRHRYDDHPLLLSHGESSVDSEYWCEACETKVDPKTWFYTCNDCVVTLHISCVMGNFSYAMAGLQLFTEKEVVAPNTSICRPLCTVCNSRCKLPSIAQSSKDGDDVYICSTDELIKFKYNDDYRY